MNSRLIVGVGSIALGVGIAASAVLGPLVLRVIDFRTSEHLENQFVGGEAVSLAIVAPMAMTAGALYLRDHRLAPALALGPALYAAYTYTTAILGQEYARYPGNVERFFPLYAGLIAGGVALAAVAWTQLGATERPTLSGGLQRSLAGIFLGIGGFFALAWAQQIRLVVAGNPPAEYQEGPKLFWVIKLLDFGFMIPLLIATGVGLVRHRPAAVRAAFGLATFATCLVASVAGMAIAMEVTGDPSAQPAMLVVLFPAVAGLTAATVRLFRAYLQPTVSEDAGRSESLPATHLAIPA